MQCENYFCVYQENGMCLLMSVKLDIQGRCKSCAYLPMSKKLKELKTDIRNNSENEA